MKITITSFKITSLEIKLITSILKLQVSVKYIREFYISPPFFFSIAHIQGNIKGKRISCELIRQGVVVFPSVSKLVIFIDACLPLAGGEPAHLEPDGALRAVSDLLPADDGAGPLEVLDPGL